MFAKCNYMIQNNRNSNIFLYIPVSALAHFFESDYTIFDIINFEWNRDSFILACLEMIAYSFLSIFFVDLNSYKKKGMMVVWILEC